MTPPLLGHKLGMTRVFNQDGKSIPVTAIQIDPCTVTNLKTTERDGYTSVQIGTGTKRHPNKPLAGQFKHLDAVPQSVREFRISTEGIEIGTVYTAADVEVGATYKLTGTSKGKGFAGVIKRHGFSRGPETHGSDHHRAPGSIGSMFPQHVLKGMRMPGRMGNEQITVRNVHVVDVLPEAGVILVKGAVPGVRGALIELTPMAK